MHMRRARNLVPGTLRQFVDCTGGAEKTASPRRHKLETSLSQLTYGLDKGDYAASAAIDSRGAAMLTATRCPDASGVLIHWRCRGLHRWMAPIVRQCSSCSHFSAEICPRLRIAMGRWSVRSGSLMNSLAVGLTAFRLQAGRLTVGRCGMAST